MGWFSWLNILGAQENAEGDYDPSPLTLFAATSSTTSYVAQYYGDNTYKGTKPILVVCTDEYKLPMSNGKVFSTGNHPVEMLVPMMHFRDAGFTFDVATQSGGAVRLEMWAYPTKDANVKKLHDDIKSMMEAPKALADITSLKDHSTARRLCYNTIRLSGWIKWKDGWRCQARINTLGKTF
jgi:molecular chaperone Hsp31 and glyoxalase 3